ncbi:MAG: type II secretion system major pseudopilin GspG [Zhongshania sp.]|uniref:type II secretion system major pseudopilin GspG n=1 Tax=Zhongshania sp. TaxID=1971902 RepID=UPI0026043047|nr:type II secretion system major pseudopilin GspG [Zhongshania sp.]MDF1691724.1 type II secretion system major pseudopilin GspG [Zhongshania sp.]
MRSSLQVAQRLSRLGLGCAQLNVKKQRGIKLWEIALVIAIASVLAIIVIVIVTKRIDTALKEQVDSDFRRISMALHQYKLDNNRYPSSAQGLMALYIAPEIDPLALKWNGPYINRETLIHDPWNNAYLYTSSDAPPGFSVSSLGADSKVGGKGLNTDISIQYQSDEH